VNAVPKTLYWPKIRNNIPTEILKLATAAVFRSLMPGEF